MSTRRKILSDRDYRLSDDGESEEEDEEEDDDDEEDV